MRDLLKRVARQSKTAIIAFKIFDNWRLKRRVNAGNIETIHGSTHLHRNVTDSLDYVNLQFNDYLTYADLSTSDLHGKTILELGPGDNLGVALKFLAEGAKTVVCLDRFFSKRNADHELAIYRALRDTLSVQEQSRFDEAIKLDGKIEFNQEKLRNIYGDTLEGLAGDLGRTYTSFDLIVSCAVLEEIYEPEVTIAAMYELLAPGGYLIHKIDLTDYGMFRPLGLHPLTFLTIPEYIYRRMASDSGLPNRKRLSYYVEMMNKFGCEAKFLVTSHLRTGRLNPPMDRKQMNFDHDEASSSLLNGIRKKLANEFRDSNPEDLLVDGLLLVARRPA